MTSEQAAEQIEAILRQVNQGLVMSALHQALALRCVYLRGCGREIEPTERCHCENDD